MVEKEERREKKGKRKAELIKLRKLTVHVASDKDNTTHHDNSCDNQNPDLNGSCTSHCIFSSS